MIKADKYFNNIVKFFVKAEAYFYYKMEGEENASKMLISDGYAVYCIPEIYHNQILASRNASPKSGLYRSNENATLQAVYNDNINQDIAHYMPLLYTIDAKKNARIIKAGKSLVFVNQAYIDLCGCIDSIHATTSKTPIYVDGLISAVILPINVNKDIANMLSFNE